MQSPSAGPTPSLNLLMRVCLALTCAGAALPITSPHPAHAATVPATASLTGPANIALGQTFTFSLDFANVGLTPGYGPYVNLFLPAAGADGDDGITFVSADVLGNSLPSTTLTCPAGGTVLSPLTNLLVNCPAAPAGANQLIILSLPFGSVAPAQATSPINIAAQLSNLADVAAPLSIAAQAGFVYGNTPNNFEPSQGTLDSLTLQPSLFDLQKAANELESETATGPNSPHRYTLTPHMPAGITATNVIITDTLPPDLVLISVTGATLISGPVIPGGPYTAPANQLVFNYGSFMGTGAPIVIHYAVTRTNALGQPVLNPLTAAPASRTNTASASANVSPLDPRDAGDVLTSTATLGSLNRALALQKQVTSTAPFYPGQIVTYTLNFQVSDFFSLGNLILTDTLSDGQTVLPGSANLILADRNGALAGAVPPAAFITASLGAAGTQVLFDVSAALVALGGADGVLQGGSTFAPASPIAATGSISYLVRIADQYASSAPLQPADPLSNTALMAGDVLSNANIAGPATSRITDTSTTAFILSGPTLSKSIFALNSNPTLPSPLKLSPNDVVTFRLVYDLATGDFNNFALTDLLPAPLFDATTLTAFISTTASIPVAGTAQWGPGMSAGDLARTPIPTLITSAADNSAQFNFPDQTDPTNTATHIEILLSVRVGSQPFADELLWVNRVNSLQINTAGQPVGRSAAQLFPVVAPKVRLSKGIVAADNPNATLTAPAGPVPFAPTSVAACGSRFTGTINSLGLQTTPINANLTQADAADIIRIALVVENIGAAREGAYDVAVIDSLPAGMAYVPGSLCVQSGNGITLAYTGPDSALFTTGITLSTPLSPGLNFAAVLTTTGRNLALLTFDGVLSGAVIPGQTLVNQAQLLHFAAQPGAPNFVPTQSPTVPVDDSATVALAPFAQRKQLSASELNNVTNGLAQVVAGERITYTVRITVPEGSASNVSVIDTLPAGLAFVGCDSISASPNLASSIGFVTSSVCSTNFIGSIATFDFGTLTNSNTNNAVAGTVQITYTAVALNVASNVTGTALINNAQLDWAGNVGAPVFASATPLAFIEPRLLARKSSNTSFGDAFDQITFRIVLTNPIINSTTLYNAVLTDVVPASMVLNSTSVTAVSGPTPLITVTVPTFTVTWPALLPGQTAVITFQTTLSANVAASQRITNTAFASGSSLPGPLTPRGPNSTATPRVYNASNASSVFLITPPQINKTLIGTDISTTANPAAQAVIGELITYSLRITVPEGFTPDVRVTDTLDSGLAFVDFAGIAASADLQLAQPALSYLTPTVSAVGPDPDRQAVWSFGAITNTNANNAVAETVQLTYTARLLNTPSNVQPQTRTNRAVLSGSNGVLAAVQAPEVQIIEPDINLSKSVATARTPIGAGDVLTYTLNLTTAGSTAGSTAALDIVLTDTLPLGISFLATQRITISNSPGTLITDTNLAGATALAWQLSSLAAGGVAQVVFTAQASPTLSPDLTLRNTAAAASSSLPGLSPFERAYTTSIALVDVNTAGAILHFSKTTLQASLTPGEWLTYTLRITNTGGVAASSVIVTDRVPANTTWVSAAPASLASVANGLVTWTVPNVAANSTALLTLTVRANESLLNGTLIVNTAHLTTPSTAQASTVTSTLATAHALALSKTASPAMATAGAVLTYTLTYTVLGNEPALGVVLTDGLPMGVTLMACEGCDVEAGNGNLRWLLGDVNPSTSGARTVTVRVAPNLLNGSVLVNTAGLTDMSDGRAFASATRLVNVGADIGISKTVDLGAGNTVVRSGALVTYTLTVTNYGPSDIAGPLPAPVPGNPSSTLGPAAIYPMRIVVADADNPFVTDLTVTVGPVSHGYAADLDLLLVGPNGQAVMLMSDAGGIRNISRTTLRFHDGAPEPPDAGRIPAGLYAPSDYIGNDGAERLPAPAPSRPYATDLAVFKGIPANGEWRLFVLDDQANDSGTVEGGWILTLATDQGNRTYTAQQGLRIEDTLPPGSTVLGGTPGFGGPNPLVWLDGILAGGTRSYTVSTRLDYAGQSPVQNTARVSPPSPDFNPGNDTSVVSLGVEYANVSVITLTQLPTLTPGSSTVITIPLVNGGNVTGTEFVITVTLPGWLDFTHPPPSWLEVAPGVWVIPIDGLPPGSDGALVLPIEVPAIFPPGVTDAAIIITIGGQDGNPGPIVIGVPVDTQPRLVFDKSASPPSGSSLYIGDLITYTLVVTHAGPLTLTQLTLLDEVPTSTAYVPGSAAPVAQVEASELRWSIGVLPPQTTLTFTFAVTLYRTSATTYPISNTATLQSAGLTATASNAVLHVYLPDRVQLSQFTIEPIEPMEGGRGNGLRIRWATMFEVDTFGFALYRSSTGQRADAVLVTAELVPAQTSEAVYEVVDNAAVAGQPNVYWLQEIETTGRVNEYGPFVMRAAAGLVQDPAKDAARLYLPVVLR